MSESGPAFGSDVYCYFTEKRVKGKMEKVKIRVRISETIANVWHTQRVRDGYTSIIRDISLLIKED